MKRGWMIVLLLSLGMNVGMGLSLLRPEASPPISFSTSATETRLASPTMVCFRQDAATAKSRAFWSSAG